MAAADVDVSDVMVMNNDLNLTLVEAALKLQAEKSAAGGVGGDLVDPFFNPFPRKKPGGLVKSSSEEILLYDVAGRTSVAQLLDGSVDVGWIHPDRQDERVQDGVARLLQGARRPKVRFSSAPWPLRIKLPLPDVATLDAMEDEVRGIKREGELGPLVKKWLEDEAEVFAYHLELEARGTRRRVQGLWKEHVGRWEWLMKNLTKKRRERVLSLVRGSKIPWGQEKPASLRCKKTGGCPDNVPMLGQARDEVWRTLHEQIVEEAVLPWDCKGRQDVHVLPKGLFPIFFVTKDGTTNIRIIIDLRRLNDYLCRHYCSVELPSVSKGRLRHDEGDWRVSFDLHSSFYHDSIDPEDRTWLGFSVSDDELPDEAIAFLWKHCPQCRYKDRWVFVYASLPMGASHSVADMQEITTAVTDSCLACGVGSEYGGVSRAWKGIVYIDDVDAATRGGAKSGVRNNSGFAACLVLALRLLAVLIWLGCHVNFRKSCIIPRRDGIFLGIGHDTEKMQFFLPKKRSATLTRRISDLLEKAVPGNLVRARDVAKVIGTIWSVQVVCHRAVSMMCRAMIRTLAEMLRAPRLRYASKVDLRWLLKVTWRGCVTWSWDAHRELTFWSKVPWRSLWAPMGYDVLLAGVADSVKHARVADLQQDVIFIASDASDIAVGGGVFKPKGCGNFSCKQFYHHTIRAGLRDAASALRELEGILDTLIAANPRRGSRVIAVVDNQSVFHILDHGSKIMALHDLAKFCFLYCLQRGIILQPIWQPRTSAIIKFCDGGSRIVDRFNYSAHPALFWEANRMAFKLWGSGFTFDRFASSEQVQPFDCELKLPFNSRFMQAYSQGADALSQQWCGHINWVNAPFSLVGQVIALMRTQGAVGAIMIPGISHQWWSRDLRRGAEGVSCRLNFDRRDPRCCSVGSPEAPPPSRSGVSVVFVDYRMEGATDDWVSTGADELMVQWCEAGRPSGVQYLQLGGTWARGFH